MPRLLLRQMTVATKSPAFEEAPLEPSLPRAAVQTRIIFADAVIESHESECCCLHVLCRILSLIPFTVYSKRRMILEDFPDDLQRGRIQVGPPRARAEYLLKMVESPNNHRCHLAKQRWRIQL